MGTITLCCVKLTAIHLLCVLVNRSFTRCKYTARIAAMVATIIAARFCSVSTTGNRDVRRLHRLHLL